MRNFRRFLRGPVGRTLTAAISLASLHAFAEPQNYLTALEAQRAKETQIREIAAKLNVDPEFLLHPEGRKTFDFRSLFAWAEAKLGLRTQANDTAQQPLDIRASIATVKSRYGLVAADATLAKIADLVRLAGAPPAARANRRAQIRAEAKSLLRVIDKDFLPPLPDSLPGVAHQRDAQLRAAMNQLKHDVKQIVNAPGALDDASLDATLAAVKSAVGTTLVLRGAKRRWTKDPFPLHDTYKAAPKKPLGSSSTSGKTTAIAATALAPATLKPRANDAVDPGVAALAATLKTPAKIFTWVHDNVLWESYSGIAKGAAGTLAERRGNDWDQAVLLRDMLASQGYQASLEWGHVTLPMSRAMNLAGTEDPLQAANLLATGGLDGVILMNGSTPAGVQLTHAWVQAFIPYVPNRGATAGTPDTWVRMDPSFKRFDYQPGIAINGNVPWNEDVFFAAGVVRPPEDAYADQIWSYIRANNLNCQNLAQVPKTGAVHAEKYPFVPSTLTAHIDDTTQTSATNPTDQLQSIAVALVDSNGATVGTWSTPIAAVWGKKVSVTFPPATADDAAIIQSYGGLYNTPAYLINLMPVFTVDDVPVAQGSPVGAGAALDMNVTFHQPNVADDFAHHDVTAGETHTLVLDPGAVPDSLLQARIDRFKTLAPGGDPSTTEKLFLVGLRYMQHVDDGLAFAAGVRWQRSVKRVFEADVRQQVNVSYTVAGSPLRLSPAEENIDVSRLAVGIVPINNDLSNRAEAMALAGLQSSYLEGAIWEEMQSQQGISAAKALLLARHNGQTLYTVDATNVDSVLASTSLSQDVQDEIRGAIAQGRIAKIAGSNISLNRWSGTGYILRDPATGAATYPISGNLAGGSTTGEQTNGFTELLGSEEWLDATGIGDVLRVVLGILGSSADSDQSHDRPATNQSDPVNLSSGNMYRTFTDFAIPARGIPVTVKRTYNSRSSYDGPFGFGWTFTYGEMLLPNADGSVTYREADGTEHSFVSNGGAFVSPPGKHMTLSSDGTGYRIHFKNGIEFTFDQSGLMVGQADLNGNRITIGRDSVGNISTVTDAALRTVLTFTTTGGHITQITDLAGRSYSYAYDGSDLTVITDPAGNQWRHTYDTLHNMTSFSDPLGNTQSYDYDGDDRVMHHVDANGAEEFFQYDIAARQSVLTDRRGGDRFIAFDDSGRATLEADPAGNVVKASFDADNNRTSIIDSRGNTTSYGYDPAGNVTQQSNPDGGTVTATYDTNSRLLSMTDPVGVTTTNSNDSAGNLLSTTRTVNGATETTTNVYDSAGQLISTTDPGGHTTTMTWNANGTLASKTDGAGNSMELTSDPLGHVLAIKDAAGNVTSIAYDVHDRITSVVDPFNARLDLMYDAAGRRMKTHTARGDTLFTYDGEGRLTSTADALGNVTRMVYDASGNVIAKIDARGNTVQFEYDPIGRVTKRVDADGGVTTYSYCAAVGGGGSGTSCASCNSGIGAGGTFCTLTDSDGNTVKQELDVMGRVVAVTDTLGHSLFEQYDKAGRRIVETDANGNATRYGYDEAGRLVSVVEANGAVAQFTYDKNGNKLTQKDANGNISSYEYDGANRRTKEIDPLGRAVAYTYDGLGNLKTKTDGNGQVTTYTYQFNRLMRIDYADATADTFAYDALGRRTQMTTPQSTINYEYDALDRITAVRNGTYGANGTILYNYDPIGNRKTMTTVAGTTRYTYDAKNRLVRIDDPVFKTFRFAYDAMDRRTSLQYPNGTVTSYAYDKSYRLTALATKDSNGNVLDAWSYQYDAVGNRTSKTDMNGAFESYQYDTVYRLARVTYGDGSTEAFTYDAAGNRLTKTDAAGTTVNTYDIANQVLKAGTVTFTYDGNGNVLTKTAANGTTTFLYDPGQRVKSIAGPDGNETNMYSADGRRTDIVSPAVSGEIRPQYDLEGNQVVELGNDNTLWNYRLYAPGVDEAVAEWWRVKGRMIYLHHDALGSVTTATNPDGSVAYHQTYRAFGQSAVGADPSGAPVSRMSFTGRESSIGGLMQYRARYYDPNNGRFLQKDAYRGKAVMPPSLNRYAYVFNNPVRYVDPTGRMAEAATLGGVLLGLGEGAGGATLGAILFWVVVIIAAIALVICLFNSACRRSLKCFLQFLGRAFLCVLVALRISSVNREQCLTNCIQKALDRARWCNNGFGQAMPWPEIYTVCQTPPPPVPEPPDDEDDGGHEQWWDQIAA